MTQLAPNIYKALRQVLPTEDYIPLHEPSFSGNEWKYVKDCLDTGWVSSVGKYVDRFERDLEVYTGIKHAVATVNGTAALHLCLELIGLQPYDEVLLPALTFVATANAVCYCKAIPHFVDSTEVTLGLCPDKLNDYLGDVAEIKSGECINRQSKRRIKAVVAMHTFGHPVDLDPLVEVCKKYHLDLVEDAAESLGSYYKGHHTGNWGVLSAMSFNGNKIITTGGGGAVLTNDTNLAKRAKHLTTTAKVEHRWEYIHDHIGYNYRLPNINAALGCAQLEQLPKYLKSKRILAQRYQKVFEKVEGVRFYTESKDTHCNYWLNVLLLDESLALERDSILAMTNDKKIMTRPAWKLLSNLPMFKDHPKMNLNIAESLERRLVNLPSSPNITSLN
jgi:perosamine synthetase